MLQNFTFLFSAYWEHEHIVILSYKARILFQSVPFLSVFFFMTSYFWNLYDTPYSRQNLILS